MVSKRLLRSAVVGLLAATAMGMVAYALAPLFDAVGFYIAPVGWLAPVVGPVISPAVNWFDPEGGPPAGVLFILICTISFWTMLFALAHVVWSSSKNGRAA